VFLKPDTPPSPRKNGLQKKLSQNGLESLISKESLILVPEGETVTTNGYSSDREDNENKENVDSNRKNSATDENSNQQVIRVAQSYRRKGLISAKLFSGIDKGRG
jgi:hypothetical protein